MNPVEKIHDTINLFVGVIEKLITDVQQLEKEVKELKDLK